MAIKLIINADDFGISAVVNTRIKDLINGDYISSATIIANSPEYYDAIRFALSSPKCSFGVHLNFYEFEPITNNPSLDCLMDSNGSFNSSAGKAKLSASALNAIESELSAQIERVAASGLNISHFDSHFHIHTRPALFLVIMRLAKRFNVKKVRLTQNLFLPHDKKTNIHMLKKYIWNFSVSHIFGLTTTDLCMDGLTLIHYLDNDPSRLDGKLVEVFLHPGAVANEDETNFFCGNWWDKYPVDIEIISYNELCSVQQRPA